MEGRPTTAPADPSLDPDAAPLDDTIEPGKRLIRLPADKGLSLGDRVANAITRLTWRTPLHAFRLKGRFPLKLLRSEEHTSELQSLMRISYAVFCLKKKKKQQRTNKNED